MVLVTLANEASVQPLVCAASAKGSDNESRTIAERRMTYGTKVADAVINQDSIPPKYPS